MNIIDKVSERDGRITPVLELIERQREEGLHSGAVMYVSQRGRVLADVALGDLQPDSVVPWLSAGKPITAVAIGQLWERGLIDLDDPVARHLPEFAVKGKEQVTIRHLLTHTAGIRWAAIEKGMKWDEIVARVCEAPMEPSWPLGEKAGYHIYTSWFILGEIVRRQWEDVP